MTKEKNNQMLSPSEFYRSLRPENFSDTELVETNLLPKEVLALELEKITTNQKENQFETLARKIAERLISPNLIPQVGPTGGGDGKTDSETFPVSTSISDRWFIPSNGWSKDEKWAIAISAKATWRSKLKSDIVSILSTKREYTRIYFITNQTPSSKRKKDTQDEFKKIFSIDIIILDGKWLIENIYLNNLVNLAVESLNLSSVFIREEKQLGSNDIFREKELIELEKNISDPERYSDYDFQLIEDAIEAAILTRQLEKPRAELEGKFDRVERLISKIDNLGQHVRFRYQKAWTYINYYDDYNSFLIEFKKFKDLLPLFITPSSIEFYSTLFTLYRNIYIHDENIINKVSYGKEKEEYYFFLDRISKEKGGSSLAMTSKMYLCIDKSIGSYDNKKELKNIFSEMEEIFVEAENRLEFPFEQFRKMVSILGNRFFNIEFDQLYDTVTKITENRNSQKEAGQLHLNRGGQKLAHGRFREALIYFGKAISKLSKNESQYGFYLSSIGLSEAYYELGLFNASYSSKVTAVSILLKPWFDEGNLNPKLLEALDSLLGKEILLGKVPHILTWHQLYRVIYYRLLKQDENEDFSSYKFDAFISIRLLNGKVAKEILEYLPSILNEEDLPLSEDASLFLLGYLENILPNYKDVGVESIDDLEMYFQSIADQPLNDQYHRSLEFFENKNISLHSNILGCSIVLNFKSTNALIITAETLLAYIECFMGTSLENLFPNSEYIYIELVDSKNLFEVKEGGKSNKYTVLWDSSFHAASNFNSAYNCCLELVSKILAQNFLMDDVQGYLRDLFENQEVTERLSIILNHKAFITNIFGESWKFTFADWKKSEVKKKEYIRSSFFIPQYADKKNKGNVKSKKKGKITDLNTIPHNKRKVLSIINNQLWDKAGWKGAGVLPSNEGVGLVIGFENIEFGEKIFEDWIERFGKHDLEDKIKISVITEVDKKNPYWYKILFSSNFRGNEMNQSSIFITSCRFHLMNATSNRNLLILQEGLRRFNKFRLYPGKVEDDLGFRVNSNLFLEKTEITFKRKDEIKENDIEYSAVINSN